MAISDGTAGAWVATTTRNPTVTLPAHSAGQMLLVRMGWKSSTPTTDVAVCNTEGWQKLGQYYNGDGVSANGGGGVLVALFWKVAESNAETDPVIEFDDATAPTPGCYSVVTYSKAATEAWVTPEGDGGSVAAATSYSGTIQSHVPAQSGDMLDAFVVTNDNTTLTVPTVTQSGLSLDTVTEYPAAALSSATSNDISADGRNRLATAGTSSAAAVVSGTNSVADPGAAWCTRLRVQPAIAPSSIASAEAFGSATVVLGEAPAEPLTIAPTAIAAPGASYAAAVLADSPLAYWRMGESTGTTLYDSSGNSRDITKNASVTLGATGALTGDSDTAISNDGTNGVGNVPSAVAPWSGDFTIEAIVKADSTSGYQGVMGGGAYLTNGFRFGRRTGRWAFWTEENGGDIVIEDPGDLLTTGVYYHLRLVRSGSTFTLYVNGTSVGSSSGTYIAPVGTVYIGAYSGGEFAGDFDEVAIFGSALTNAADRYALVSGSGGSALGSPTVVLGEAPGTPLTIAPTSINEPAGGEVITESYTVLLVVADAAAPTTGDALLADHLRVGLGATVTYISDETTEPSLTGYDVVVIGESCNSTTLGTKYKSAAIGLVHMENGAWDEHGLITGGSAGTVAAQTQVTTTGTHDILWDLATGNTTVATTSFDAKHSNNLHGASAVAVGHIVGTTTYYVCFAYAAGATLADSSTAAGRRVALGFPDASYPNLNENGWSIFDAAVRWAAGEANPAFTRSATYISDVDVVIDQGEHALISRIRGSGFDVTIVDDDSITSSTGASDDIIFISKKITSTKLNNTLKSSTVPILFWEDNAQAPAFFGTIDDTNVTGTAWHGLEDQLAINASAPAALKAGLSGTIDFYRTAGTNNITYAPETDGGAQTLSGDAIKIAEYATSGDGRWSLYVYDAGDTLGDGTIAAGKRGFFGLYDAAPEARYLTLDAIALWDAMVAWLVGAGTAFGQLTVVLGEAPVAGTITPAGISSIEAFGTAAILPGSRTIQPSAINSAEALGTATILRGSRALQPTAINSAETFGTVTVPRGSVSIQPSGIASAQAFGTASLPTGASTIQPSGIASAEAFGTATLSTSGGAFQSDAFQNDSFQMTEAGFAISPTGLVSAEAFGTATLIPASRTVVATGIASAEALGTAVLSRGAVAIQPSAIASAEAFGTTALRKGGISIQISTINSAEAFGTATLTRGAVAIVSTGLPSVEVFGTATVGRGSVTIQVSSITSLEAFGSATLTAPAPGTTILTTGVASLESFGTAVISRGAVSIQPTAISSAETSGPQALRSSAAVTPTAIASTQALGTPALAVGGVAIQPSAITTAEAFGSVYLNAGQMLFGISAIASSEAFGTATLRPGSRTITTTGIVTAAAVGTPVLAKSATIQPSGIASSEQTGLPAVIRGAVTIGAQGIATGEGLGTTTIVSGAGIVVPTAIGSAQAFGNPTVSIASIPTQYVEPTAIDSVESFGTTVLRAGNVNLILLGIGTAELVPVPQAISSNEIQPTSISAAELFGLPILAVGPAYIRPTGVSSAEVFGEVVLGNLLDSWLWVNRSPAMTDTRTGGFPVLQSGLYGTRRQEGEG